MKVQIHAIPAREEYVRKFLIPRLRKQGFRDISVFVDNGCAGNLAAYITAYEQLPDKGDVWHLEDDVLPDGRFYKWAKGLSYFHGIVCGYASGQYYGLRDFGYCDYPEEMFFSFPCIRIPCETIKAFLQWFRKIQGDKRYRKQVQSGKCIDSFFRAFLIYERDAGRDVPIFHFKPCIVEHMDRELGGSICNPERIQVRALLFEDEEARQAFRRWRQ